MGRAGTIAFLLARSLSVLAAAAAAALAPAPAAAETPFAPCAADGLLCATLTVPLDYTGAAPGQVSLHVEELPAAGTPRGVVMLLAGGPGQASAETFNLANNAALWQSFFPGYTLVAYDDRGTGESGALDCTGASTTGAVDFASFVGACLGPNRVFYTTPQHAEDMESVRAALGVDKLAIFGASYGTKQAVAYALAHPDHVERLVLDSEDLPEGDPLGTLSLRAIPLALGSICSGGACHAVTRDPAGDFARLANRLEVSPVGTRAGLADGLRLLELAYSSDLDPSVATELPAATSAALAGWTEPLTRLLVLDGLWQRRLGSVDEELLVATDCGDGAFPWQPTDPPELRQAAVDAAVAALPPGSTGPFGGWATGVGLAALCKNWPAPAGTAFPPGPLPDVPVLVLSGDRDVRTPTAAAVAIAARFPQGRVLVLPGLGHSVLKRSQCAAAAVRGWLDGAAPPAACPRVTLPVQPIGPFRRTVAGTPPAPGVPGLTGRTLTAALATLKEAEATWLFAGPGLTFLPALVTGGLAARGAGTFALQEYSDTPGVTLTGTVLVELAGSTPLTPLTIKTASLTVGGTAARGTLHVAGGRVSGRLGGRTVTARF